MRPVSSRMFVFMVGALAILGGVIMALVVAPSQASSCQTNAVADAVVYGTIDDCSSAGTALKWAGWVLIAAGAISVLYTSIVRPSRIWAVVRGCVMGERLGRVYDG